MKKWRNVNENDKMCCDDEFGSKQVGCKILMQNGEINMKYLEIQIGMHQL